MPEKVKGVQLGPKELAEMRGLTHELSEVLGKISRVILTTLGEKAADCKSFAISLPQSGKPLLIECVESAGVLEPTGVILGKTGYGGQYIDPPGV